MSTVPEAFSALVRRGTSDGANPNRFDENPVGWLAVYIEFLGEPVKELKLKFYTEDMALMNSPAPAETNAHGIYVHGLIAVGRYLCQIEGQKRLARITTVEDKDKPFCIVLPVGRPYFDIAVDAKLTSFQNNP